EVRGGEHGVQVRVVGQEPLHRGVAAAGGEVADGDRVRGQAHLREGGAPTREPVETRGHGGRTGDRPDAASARGDEVLGREPRALGVVHVDVVGPGEVQGPADVDAGQARVDQLPVEEVVG